MRYAEVIPINGNSCVIVDGMEWSRHDEVKIAEQVRHRLVEYFVEETEKVKTLQNSI